MMKSAAIFLAGDYRENLAFYRQLCRDRTLVAADGGHRFFDLARLRPDILIGDLDSITGGRSELPHGITIIEHPREKDCTDGELALRYCLTAGASKIDLVDPSTGEIDHLLGNLFLLELARRHSVDVRARIVSHRAEVRLMSDSSWTIVGEAGEVVSIVPLSSRIRSTCTGVEYPTQRLCLRRGQTRSLRNSIARRRARVEIEGKAFVVHGFRK